MKLLPQHAFKMLNPDGTTPQQGHQWHLPRSPNVPGKWMTPINGELEACANGYHLLRPGDLIEWLGPELWLAEWRGKRVDADDKVVVKQARLLHKIETYNDRNLRLFAADVAERAMLRLAENERDPRSMNAIAVARNFANGEATPEELSAAWDAAWASARDAAWDAAWASARDAARDAAWDAAWDAARDAARDAAWDAARAAAWDAARAAAGDAAGDAARAAAGDAAWDAAWAAERDAAWAAEREFQTELLLKYLGIEVPEAAVTA